MTHKLLTFSKQMCFMCHRRAVAHSELLLEGFLKLVISLKISIGLSGCMVQCDAFFLHVCLWQGLQGSL